MRNPGRGVLIKACLNGNRHREEHSAIPLTPDQIADAGRRAVGAGAAALHVHPRGHDGRETLDPQVCDRVITALRNACPGIPLGLTTAAWIERRPERRLALVSGWTVLADFASVNFSEIGTSELCGLLRERGIGIEVGLWSRADAHLFLESGIASSCLRVLIEADESDPQAAVRTAATIDGVLDQAGITVPRLHHGVGMATWAVVEQALDRGHDIRVGLEDTLVRPDGSRTRDNAELVELAVELVQRHGRSPALVSRTIP